MTTPLTLHAVSRCRQPVPTPGPRPAQASAVRSAGPLTALLLLSGRSVAELAVAGDTPSDIESGLRAGAGLVAGVLTGDCGRAELEAVPARTGLPGSPLILESIADLLPHLGI